MLATSCWERSRFLEALCPHMTCWRVRPTFSFFFFFLPVLSERERGASFLCFPLHSLGSRPSWPSVGSWQAGAPSSWPGPYRPIGEQLPLPHGKGPSVDHSSACCTDDCCGQRVSEGLGQGQHSRPWPLHLLPFDLSFSLAWCRQAELSPRQDFQRAAFFGSFICGLSNFQF